MCILTREGASNRSFPFVVNPRCGFSGFQQVLKQYAGPDGPGGGYQCNDICFVVGAFLYFDQGSRVDHSAEYADNAADSLESSAELAQWIVF